MAALHSTARWSTTCKASNSKVSNRPVRPTVAARAEPAASQGQNAASSLCKTCGQKADSGCDGEGRVVGGLGALPGFGWWPIKAYRPCPGLNAAGMDYVRKGQPLNDMLFGGVSLGPGAASLDAMKEQQDKGLDVK
eukprot:CAMPEP_0119107094 /NCGR_PEP_ID=MMETSP1180-20130426/7947_1 /TAXON_ID=3052 ORGANISM="Chlamydomonas cf sp, Strain CCMP681" /NCGR_SAMPLE_ID=MMETSP1180 /ASSEMBLY_ACC=CAM_ASM_000741 /LENGTH=135 /DNA_ID=CAMNT_0007092529 /DNA_START=25 /DNA_END=435 /DNA_ORIENTATION=+